MTIAKVGSTTKRIFFLSVGTVSLTLGLIGILLPLVPTTPFLLLAAYCFNKSSERFHTWLVTHPILGTIISDWKRNRVIRLKTKLAASAMTAIPIAFMVIFKPLSPAIKGMMLTILTVVLLFVWIHPSKPKKIEGR